MTYKHILLFSIAALLLFPAEVQAQKKRLKRADAAFEAGEYFEAIDLYKDAYAALKDREEKTRVVFYIAESYRLTNQSGKAELWYKKAVSYKYPDPIAVLHYAESLKKNEKYDDAMTEFTVYKDLVPDDTRGEEGIRSCELALKWMEQSVGYEVAEMKYFNSRQRDYSPAYVRDDYQAVYFTSSREDANGSKTHGATGQSFSDIFESKKDRKGKWSTPVALDEIINSEFEEGTPTLTGDYNTMYFTRCEMSKRKKLGCLIMESKRTEDGWGKAEPLDILSDSLVVAHPSVSKDGNLLLFVSDMKGGEGEYDIWRIERGDGGGWSEPQNMGPQINTEGNELFPYVHADGSIYFSSDRHLGMGGHDIFRATQTEDGDWNVENMRYPINSSSDDFGIIFQDKEEMGFFSSTRKGRGNDDIYAFTLPPLDFNIKGVVLDRRTEEFIPGATVKLIGSDGLTIDQETAGDGSFTFTLKPNTDYIFLGSKQGYLISKGRETTKGQEQSKDFRMTLELAAIDKPIELPNIFYDFGKWELRPESMVALDRLVEALNDNANITIELGSHTDIRDSEAFNLDLSQKRAQSVIDYLISKDIASDRLVPKGYGESVPKVVDPKNEKAYPFLKDEDILNEDYINKLANEEQKEVAHQLNRRTELMVLSTDYKAPQE